MIFNVAPGMLGNVANSDSCLTADAMFHALITPTGNPPIAYDDSYVIDEDMPLLVSAPGILDNDYDEEGDDLTARLYIGPSSGVLSLAEDGSFSYMPNSDFFGIDSFTYVANDGESDSNIATVAIFVNSVNDIPIAVNDVYYMDEDEQLNIQYPGVLANDYDADPYDYLTAELVTGPQHGSLLLIPQGDFTYTPFPDWYGADYFEYRVSDSFDYSNIATVTIIVNPVNDAPVAVDDELTTNLDVALYISTATLLSNDYDVDGDALQVIIESYPSYGKFEVLSDHEFVYTPDPGWLGTDSFSYRLSDDQEYSGLAYVRITVSKIIQDTTPPTTKLIPDGVLGDKGWYISDVTITLLATDDFSVDKTLYSLDGKNFLTYSGPFIITADGLTTVWYYSNDTAGNIETMNSESIIIDTDITGPVITITYIGDGTDGNPGYWFITVDDLESGIDTITVEIDGVLIRITLGDYAVPNSLGPHTIRVNATNADLKMGIEDQEFSTLSMTVMIIDDDTTAPEISINHTGGTTTDDSGSWTVTVVDMESSIASIIVEIDGVLVGTAAGDYAVPNTEGEHTITVTAYNNDLDRGEIDQEMSVASANVTITSAITPGFVTGGGWIVDANGNKAHFAFVVHLSRDGELSGVFLYQFKECKRTYIVVGIDFLRLFIDGNYAYFEVNCSIMEIRHHSCKVFCINDGYIVRVDIWEGQGKRARDIFQIIIYDPSGQVVHMAGFDPFGYVHGAIVIHEYRHLKGCHCYHRRW